MAILSWDSSLKPFHLLASYPWQLWHPVNQYSLTPTKHQTLLGKILGPHFSCRFGVTRTQTEERTEHHRNTYPRLGRGDVTGKVPGRDGLSLERQVLTRQKWVGRRGQGISWAKAQKLLSQAQVNGSQLRVEWAASRWILAGEAEAPLVPSVLSGTYWVLLPETVVMLLMSLMQPHS